MEVYTNQKQWEHADLVTNCEDHKKCDQQLLATAPASLWWNRLAPATRYLARHHVVGQSLSPWAPDPDVSRLAPTMSTFSEVTLALRCAPSLVPVTAFAFTLTISSISSEVTRWLLWVFNLILSSPSVGNRDAPNFGSLLTPLPITKSLLYMLSVEPSFATEHNKRSHGMAWKSVLACHLTPPTMPLPLLTD